MEYRRLGRTGLKVSTICLGTMQFGWTAEPLTAHQIMTKAVELGCNFFDTADIYSGWASESYVGKSEEIIGEWLTGRVVPRHELILATKVRGRVGNKPTNEGLSRQHILHAVEASLKRLHTDYIDLYQLHWPDEETPLEETLEALNNLVQRGLVRYIGCSNYPAWLLMKALWVSDVRQLARFETVQPHYNLVHRPEFERELQAVCLDQKVGAIPYSPLANGFLTGKYRRDQALPASARSGRVQQRYFNEQGFAAVEKCEEIGRGHNATIAQTALAWLLANPAVNSAIIGANSVAQLEETAKGVTLKLSHEEKQTLDEVTSWQ